MLRTMRNNLKSLSWTLWLVIIAFIGFVFVEWGTGGMNLTGGKDSLVTVGKQSLSGRDFQKKLQLTIENYRNQMKKNFNRSMVEQLRLPEQMLQQTINSMIIQHQAKELKIKVSDTELKEKIVSYPGFQRNGKFIGVRAYENLLAYNHIDIKDFEADLRREIVGDKLKSLVTSGLIIENSRLESLYHQKMDKAELEYIKLLPDSVKEKIDSSRSQLEGYYNTHKNEFLSREKRAGTIIAYKYEDFRKDLKLTGKDYFNYYKKNKKNFVIPAKTKVSRILLNYENKTRARILKKAEELSKSLTDKNFAAKAREFSQDDKASLGGDWGYYGWRGFSTTEQKIIESLDHREISSPVDTGNAFALLFMNEKTARKQQQFDEVEDRIRKVVDNEALSKIAKARLETVYKKISSSQNLPETCKTENIPCQETGFLSEGETIKEVNDMGYISRKLFGMNLKAIEFPVQFAGGIAILQLNAIARPEIEPFDKVLEKVKDKYVQAMKMQKLASRAAMLVKKLNSTKNKKALDKVLKQNGLELKTFSYQRGNRLADLPLKKDLDTFIFSAKNNTFASPLPYESAVLLIRPLSIHVMSKEDFQNSKTAFYNSKLGELQNRVFATYVYNKRESSEILLNQKLFEKIKNSALSRIN